MESTLLNFPRPASCSDLKTSRILQPLSANLGMKFWMTLLLAGSIFAAHGRDYDLILRNGRIADGTGNPALLR